MSKIEGSWSGMRKYLEKEIIAESLKGRVRYNCTRYVGMETFHVFELYIDGVLIKRFSMETVNSYFLAQTRGEAEKPFGIRAYWKGFWDRLHSVRLQDRTEYTDDEFCDALNKYRNQSIADSIDSEDPLVVMFAILDRRVGKRTLAQLEASFEGQPQWLQNILNIRTAAENMQ